MIRTYRTIALRWTVLALAAALAPIASAQQFAPASQNAAMQEFMSLMNPGEGHKVLAKMTGKWSGKTKTWNSATPGGPPMNSTDESEGKLVLGGRFVLIEASGSMMGMPMQRMSLLGYDNYKKTYTQVFYSSFGTATNIAHGSIDATGKIITLHGEFDDPTGKYPFKNVIRLESDDRQIFESYRIDSGGKELKVIEAVFTRIK